MPASKGNDERVPAERQAQSAKFSELRQISDCERSLNQLRRCKATLSSLASSVSFTQPLAAEQNLPTVNLTKLTITPVRSIDSEALMHSAFEIFDGPFGALFVLVLCAAMVCL